MNVLCFGEILYDCIGEEKKLGGAPLNVAGHIAQMGRKGSCSQCCRQG